MAISTLTAKGQTTIPKDIREHLRLRPGDRMEFIIESDGRVLLLPVTLDAAELEGALPRPTHPVSLDEMEAAIRRRSRGNVRD